MRLSVALAITITIHTAKAEVLLSVAAVAGVNELKQVEKIAGQPVRISVKKFAVQGSVSGS